MTIELHDIRTAVRTYFSTRVIPSIVVSPLPGNQHINPTELFNITLKAQNSVGHESTGVLLLNVRYHVRVLDATKATLIVPPSTTAVARKGASRDDDTLTPGTAVQEMFLFPRGLNSALDPPGDTDNFNIQGRALAVGTVNLRLNLLADVALDFLFPKDQSSEDSSTPVSIEPT